ncbi:MAG: NAD(P)/FAD-dependent oxidoreductase [Anaerolineales bacterium]
MPILVRNISLDLDEPEEVVLSRAASKLRIPVEAIRSYSVVARSVDARHGRVRLIYQIEMALDEPAPREASRLKRLRGNDAKWIERRNAPEPTPGSRPLRQRPVVVGFGPAGMFAALRLAQYGYCPIVLERGQAVKRRHKDVLQRYYRERDFDAESNLLFGEGGAGTYSDGKLYTRVSDDLCRYVLEELYRNGADPDILIDARPHIGSDRLPTICTRIRKRIEFLGGEVRFAASLRDIRVEEGAIGAIEVGGGQYPEGTQWEPVDPLILAVGHSARDTIRMLKSRGVRVDVKSFQIGVRIEHPQSMIDAIQFGSCASHERLGPAEYQVVAKGAACSGDMYSFCMCPGGEILPTNESPGLIATNGASRAKRASPFANSGLVITIDPARLGLDALAAMAYQEHWEKAAFEATGRTYAVPAQRATDFLAGRASDGALATSFPLGAQWTDIRSLIPEEVGQALERALPMLDARLPGFAGADGIITAPETRASAPIRITRDRDTRAAFGYANLYPVGEGAGYAGGIVSAAVDGIKTADLLIAQYAPPG